MNAVILGGADSLHADMDTLAGIAPSVPWGPDLGPGWLVFAVNDAVSDYGGPLAGAVTLHPDKMERWLRERVVRWGGAANVPVTWCHRDGSPQLERVLPVRHGVSGSSGLFAVQVAQHLGCKRIVLCGVPMTPTAHFDKPGAWEDCKRYTAAWQVWKTRGELVGVRSMSGWTRDILGLPDEDWLRGDVPVGILYDRRKITEG